MSDAAEIDRVIESQLPRLVAYARLRMGHALLAVESVSDVVQSACREAIADLEDSPAPDEAFQAWLFRAVRRKIVDRQRHHAAEKRGGRQGRLGAPVLLESERLMHTVGGRAPDDVVAAREDLERLVDALASLPETDREIVLGKKILGLSHEELARDHGLTVVNVRSRLSRALARVSAVFDAS